MRKVAYGIVAVSLRRKTASKTLVRLQDNRYRRDGRYAESVGTIDPDGVLRDMFVGADTACTVDGEAYIVWAVAQTGYFFAHSNREGRDYGWQYAGDAVPTEPGPGAGWHSVLDEPTHPDW
jgi:ribosomal protein S16